MEHARQVVRLLPGGLSIIGVFTVSDDKEFFNTKLITPPVKEINLLLASLSSHFNKNENLVHVHIQRNSNENITKLIAVKTSKMTKVDTVIAELPKLCLVKSKLLLSAEKELSGNILEDTKELVNDWAEIAKRFVVRISKSGENCEIYSKSVAINKTKNKDNSIRLSGNLIVSALVIGKEKPDNVSQYLKSDISENLKSRYELLNESVNSNDSHVLNAGLIEKLSLSLPKRVLYSLDSNVVIADLISNDENEEDSVDRVSYLLGKTPIKTIDFEKSIVIQTPISHEIQNSSQNKQVSSNYLMLYLPIMIAIILAYLIY